MLSDRICPENNEAYPPPRYIGLDYVIEAEKHIYIKHCMSLVYANHVMSFRTRLPLRHRLPRTMPRKRTTRTPAASLAEDEEKKASMMAVWSRIPRAGNYEKIIMVMVGKLEEEVRNGGYILHVLA
ncbi:hypothetical protein IG631_16957 [Alternaria alternata]|nr:hypothetical protein IG631_16957 [Alternaria alternata]